jgi:cysteinyl-tRNA synthetase
MVDGEKMSKSLGNFMTVHELVENGVKGEVIRFLFLTTHYRKPLNWTKKLLQDSKKSLDSFYRVISDSKCSVVDLDKEVLELLKGDLNTPAVISVMHKITTQYYQINNENERSRLASQLYSIGHLLGLFYSNADIWFRGSESNDNDFVEQMIKQRIAARETKNWKEADNIRDKLKAVGVILEDHGDGSTTWHKED